MKKRKSEAPLLLAYLYGEGADAGAASKRLLRWCAGFEAWLAERRETRNRRTYRRSACAWERWLGQCAKLKEGKLAEVKAHFPDIYRYFDAALALLGERARWQQEILQGRHDRDDLRTAAALRRLEWGYRRALHDLEKRLAKPPGPGE